MPIDNHPEDVTSSMFSKPTKPKMDRAECKEAYMSMDGKNGESFSDG
jgi:hypothetical protein